LTVLRVFVEPAIAFLYLLLLVALINYNYVVAYFPYLKNLYVASAGLIPILILSLLLKQHRLMITTMCALFAYLLGRELLLDTEDLGGDGNTLVRMLGANAASILGFSFEAIAAVVLLVAASNVSARWCAATILAFEVIFAMLWPVHGLRRAILHAMKVQLALGIAYIVLE
jgi:hypothetical protein